jgi:CheY-like chemotaxis protein
MSSKWSKILVVDDLADWRTTLSGLLTDEGYQVQVADSSAGALKAFETDRFDLAVLDIRLNERDEGNTEGLELAAKIKERWPNVQVILITGYGTQAIMRQALEANDKGQRLVADYIPKTQTEDLVKTVRKVLKE